ncbi:MAG: hypothetical protein Q8N89_10580 [Azonexus sp.]|nr:hypothetical protein [Azonexus sp.]
MKCADEHRAAPPPRFCPDPARHDHPALPLLATSSACILAMRMGGDGKSVAWLISATTLSGR